MKHLAVFLVIATAMTLAACGGAASQESPLNRDSGFGGGAPEVGMAPAEAPMPAVSESYDASTANTSMQLAQIERKIIKNADLSLVVKDPAQSMKDITALAGQMGGYVVSSNLYQSYYGPNNITVPEGNIAIRIPEGKLNDALEQIKTSAVEVQSENVSGQDVTDQYVDLQSRLAAKQATEKKLLEIMDQADKTEDVLAVYQQLQQVQSDIEVLKGQIKYIDQSAAMSSVSVHLIAEETVQPLEVGGWKIEGTARDAIQDLVIFLQGFTRFLIQFFLNYIWRILLIGLPLYGVFAGMRALIRRTRKPKAKVEKVVEESQEK